LVDEAAVVQNNESQPVLQMAVDQQSEHVFTQPQSTFHHDTLKSPVISSNSSVDSEDEKVIK